MIIQFASPSGTDLTAATCNLNTLVQEWGVQLIPGVIDAAEHCPSGDAGKALDPIPLAALVLSLPSAILAVGDLTDRIRSRRRAQQLIEHAQRLAEQNITATVTIRARTLDLHTLTPDELIDLNDDDTGTDQPAG